MRDRALVAAPALLAAVLLYEIFLVLPSASALVIVACVSWMALPGVLLARHALGGGPDARRSAWLLGPALGFGFSVFGLLLLWAAGLKNGWALVLAPFFTVIVAAIVRWTGGAVLRLPALDRRDLVAVALAALVVPGVTLLPYAHVDERVPEGEAYRAYFTADFVWAMSASAEIAKGEVPPANPFLTTEPMRYYWMSHLLSGVVYRNVRALDVPVEAVVLIDGLGFGLAFVGFFYWLGRAAGAGPAAMACAVVVGFLANSYEGADVLWGLTRGDEPLSTVKTLNIDAITRWFYQGMPVDGLQRMLLYQPHHLTGYVMALSALWLVGLAEDVSAISIALWAGILLALGLLFSTFTAIIVGCSVGLLYALRLMQQRRWKAVLQCALLGAAPVAVGVALTNVLGYTNPKDGALVSFGLNPVALRQWPYVLLLNFGPLLIGGVAGLLLRWRWAISQGAATAALAAGALLFYFTADVPNMGGVWVGWRSGHLLLITFSVITAAAMTAWWTRPALRIPLAAAAVCAVIPGTATVAIDVYNAQDISNREAGPTFPWTLIISPAEREALNWIKRATPVTARVQVEPHVRDTGTWAYIPAFAERRMAAGLPISMIPLAPYQEASEAVRAGIYQAHSASDAHAAAERLGIDYVVVGREERQAYAPAVERLAERPDLFLPVFRNDAVTVYGVVRHQ